METASTEFLLSILRTATPLLFAALGGLLSEKSGIPNIALEGKLLLGAFVAASVTYYSGSPLLGFVAGGLGAVLLGVLFSGLILTGKGNPIIIGMGLNTLMMGLLPLLCKFFFETSNSTPPLSLADRLGYSPTIICGVVLILVILLLQQTKFGLWVIFAGEKPEALKAAGISVTGVRWVSILWGSFLAGLGGSTLSIALSSSFTKGMSSGRGFMALAALVLGRWRPIPTACACLLIGFGDALQIFLQSQNLGIPVQWIQTLPYLLTLILVAGWLGGSRAPAALSDVGN